MRFCFARKQPKSAAGAWGMGDDGTKFLGRKINGGVEPLKKGILIGKKPSIGVDGWLTFRERS